MSKATRLPLALWGLSILTVLLLVAVGLAAHRSKVDPLPVIAEVPDFTFTHHDRTTIRREDLRGSPWIADFIFTRCPAICPRMTAQMSRVAKALGEETPIRIASFSVDPEHDTPEVLARYAEANGAGKGWYFLTGAVEAIHALSREGFLLGVDASPTPEIAGNDPILHSNRFVLVDSQSRIRGYYDPFDEAELERLLDDVRSLLVER